MYIPRCRREFDIVSFLCSELFDPLTVVVQEFPPDALVCEDKESEPYRPDHGQATRYVGDTMCRLQRWAVSLTVPINTEVRHAVLGKPSTREWTYQNWRSRRSDLQ